MTFRAKTFFQSLFAVAAIAGAGLAQAEPVVIVQIASFDCAHCKKAEACYDTLKHSIEKEGGRFLFAPVPNERQTGGRESLYYASRYDETLEAEVRKTLFAAQGMPGLADTSSTQGAISWLSMQSSYPYWEQLAQYAETQGKPAMQRAVKLAVEAGVSSLPTYLVVKEGKPSLLHQGAPANCNVLLEKAHEVAK